MIIFCHYVQSFYDKYDVSNIRKEKLKYHNYISDKPLYLNKATNS